MGQNLSCKDWLRRIDQFAIRTHHAENVPVDTNRHPYASICNTISAAIFIIRASDGVFTFVNDGFIATTGWDRADVLGKPFQDLNLWYQSRDRDAILEKLAEGASVRDVPTQVRRKDGRGVPCRMSASSITMEGCSYIVVNTIDISLQKSAEKEKQQIQIRLNQLQRMESIGALAAGIAHDFNNILFPINGYAEMLVNDLPDGTRLREIADDILAAGMRGRDLIEQILTISQEEGQKFKSIMPHLIVKETLKLIRSTFPKHIGIEQYIDPQCDCLMGDPAQIRQVVMNLATNAYHAMEDAGGLLTITLKNADFPHNEKDFRPLKPGAHILLSVADTGIGMDRMTQDRIFDPYFSTKPHSKGTGLGLAVVHGIVTRHMGRIRVESDVGKGTVFNIYFPADNTTGKTIEPAESGGKDVGKVRVLFVDDDNAILKTGRMMLERIGCRVETYQSSMKALDAFKIDPDRIDVVLSDQSMPKMTGDRLAAEIRKVKPNTPIIICTGYGEDIPQTKADRIGINGKLKKPITMSELTAVLHSALDAAMPE